MGDSLKIIYWVTSALTIASAKIDERRIVFTSLEIQFIFVIRYLFRRDVSMYLATLSMATNSNGAFEGGKCILLLWL